MAPRGHAAAASQQPGIADQQHKEAEEEHRHMESTPSSVQENISITNTGPGPAIQQASEKVDAGLFGTRALLSAVSKRVTEKWS